MDTLGSKTSDFYSLITDKLASWLDTLIVMLPNILVAVLIVLAFALIAKLVRKGLNKVLNKFSESTSLNNLALRVVYVAIICVGTFVALSVLKLDKAVTSLLAGAGIIGLALGFAFQDIAANFMSGVMLAVRKPIRVGDLIETNDIFGIVQRVNLRATEIQNLQGQRITVPNKLIFENPIQNYTISGVRRVDIECGVSYGDDLNKVKEITIQALKELSVVNQEKGITFFYKEFGGSSINFQARFWLNKTTTQPAYLEAMSQSIVAIKAAYDANGIDIPFPIRTLDFGIKGGEKLSEMVPLNGEALS